MKLLVPTLTLLLTTWLPSEARLEGRISSREQNDKLEARNLAELAAHKELPIKQMPDVMMCTAQMKKCPNGKFVGPDPKNNCKFPECPTEDESSCCDPMMPQVMRCAQGMPACCETGEWICSQEGVYDCGVSKTKEPPKGKVCKEEPPRGCPRDIQHCPNGPPVARDPKNGCKFFPCRDIKPSICKSDAKICPDDTTVVRNPDNDCEFFPCKSIIQPVACKSDTMLCPDGSEMKRDLKLSCEFPHCVKPQGCTKELKSCNDGSKVGRDSKNNCNFAPCPDKTTSDREKLKAAKEAERLRRQELKEKAKAEKEQKRAERLAARQQKRGGGRGKRGG